MGFWVRNAPADYSISGECCKWRYSLQYNSLLRRRFDDKKKIKTQYADPECFVLREKWEGMEMKALRCFSVEWRAGGASVSDFYRGKGSYSRWRHSIQSPYIHATPGIPAPTHLEVFVEDLDFGRAFPHCVLPLQTPRKLECRPKRAVPPGQRSVDDVLAIATHHHKAAVGVVLQALRIQARQGRGFRSRVERRILQPVLYVSLTLSFPPHTS